MQKHTLTSQEKECYTPDDGLKIYKSEQVRYPQQKLGEHNPKIDEEEGKLVEIKEYKSIKFMNSKKTKKTLFLARRARECRQSKAASA